MSERVRRRRMAGGGLFWPAVVVGVLGCGSNSAAPDGGVGPGGTGTVGSPDGATVGAGRPQPAFDIFDGTRLHDVALTMSPEDWQSILDDSRGDEDRHATLSYDGVVLEEVGVRPSGETSRFAGNPKMSIRIGFDAFQKGKFGGIDELKLKGQWDDGSMMRDGLAKFVYRSTVPTGKEGYARLVVNGDVRGLYAVLEMWNAESLKTRYTEPLGPLYRIRGGAPPLDPYKYIGSDSAAYMPLPWEPHIKHALRGDDVITAFLGAIAMAPATIETVIDMDTLLGYLAASTLVQSVDGMVGDSGVQDHYQYFDPVTGKFFTLPWDPDKTFGAHGEAPDRGIYLHFSKTVPTVIVRDTPDLRGRYRAKITATIAAAPLAAVQAEADRIYQLIKDAAHEDPVKRFDNNTFDWNLGYLKDFVSQRYANVQSQVATGF